MTLNTDAPGDDAPDASGDDAASPDSLILDSFIQHKIDPNSMLRQKIKMKVSDANAATKNNPPNAINTPPYSTNASTSPDNKAANVENKRSARQWIDGQEYPVDKGDIIKKGFYHEAAVEQCVA